MEVENSECLFVFVAHYQQKEFVGQKAITQEVEEEVAGNTIAEVLDNIWFKAATFIKREILVDGDNIAWAEAESPDRSEIGNFIILQDKAAKKNYLISQLNTDVLRKMRNKHVNVMVHVYGKAISSKAIHVKVAAAILQPAQRDRAGAHSTVVLVDLARSLKEKHGNYLVAHTSSWTMWANAIHSAPTHRQTEMLDEMPPPHLIHLFRSIPTTDAEKMRSAQSGVQIAGNMVDSFAESVKFLREEFNKLKEGTLRGFDLYERRLDATEQMLNATTRLVSSFDHSLQVEVNPVSIEEEAQITDLPDHDHN